MNQVPFWRRAWLQGWLLWLASAALLVCTRQLQQRLSGFALAAESPQLSVELGVPSYFAEELRHPQHFFSGRKIKVVGSFPTVDSMEQIQTVLRGTTTAVERELIVDRATSQFVRVEIPADIPTDTYELSLTFAAATFHVSLELVGITEAETQGVTAESAMPLTAGVALLTGSPPSSAILYQNELGCGPVCYWESVLAGHPTSPDHLMLAGLPAGYTGVCQGVRTLISVPPVHVSHDGGQTWSPMTFTNPDFNWRVSYCCDPKIAVTPEGTALHAELGHFFQGDITGSELSGPVFPAGGFLDRPLLAYDPTNRVIYVTGWAVGGPSGVGLFVSRDSGQTFKEQALDYRAGFTSSSYVKSIDTTPEGSLRAIFLARRSGMPTFQHQLHLLRFDPSADSFEVVPGPILEPWTNLAQRSTGNVRSWFIWTGPELAVDQAPASPHRGRLYLLWARPASIVEDPNFEFSHYGFNFDIYLAYSDDDGQTWSPARKVNDDATTADQGYPSIRVDATGVVHVAFMDKREQPDLAGFDVYYATVKNGRISKNIRVNEAHFSLGTSTSLTPIGDYLDMIVAYPERAYISYPCIGTCGFDSGGCTGQPCGDACVTAVDPRLVPFPLTLEPIGDRNVNEGDVVQFTVAASDDLNDYPLVLTAQMASGDPLLTIEATFTDHGDGTGTLSWTPTYQQSGDYSLVFTVSDGELLDSETITIRVANVNRAPVLAPIGPKTVTEGQLLGFTVSATDPDGQPLTWKLGSLPDVNADGFIDWADAERVFEFFAQPADTPEKQRADLNSDGVINLQDIDLVRRSGLAYNGNERFELATATFSWTPNFDQAGIYTVTFTVSDGILTDSETITITVTDVNRPPTLSLIGNKTVDERQLLVFTVSASDPEGTALTFTAGPLPGQTCTPSGCPILEGQSCWSGPTFVPLGNNQYRFTWRPSSYVLGAFPNFLNSVTFPITFSVSDGVASASESITITVLRVPAPTITLSVSPTTIEAGSPFTVTISGASRAGLASVWWWVQDVNDPSWHPIPGTVDGVRLTNTYGLAAAQGFGSCYGQTSCSYARTVTIDNAGTYKIWVNARDLLYADCHPHQASEGSGILSVQVENLPPVLAPLSNQTTAEGSTLTFSISGSDPNGDAVSLSMESTTTTAATGREWLLDRRLAGLQQPEPSRWTQAALAWLLGEEAFATMTYAPPAPSFSDAGNGTGTFSWSPSYLQAGTYQVTFAISDGKLKSAQTITVTVEEVTDPPVAHAGADQTVESCRLVTLDGSGSSDPDGDPITYQWIQTAGPAVSLADPTSARPSFSSPWVSAVTNLQFLLRVSDGRATATDSVTSSVNPPPGNAFGWVLGKGACPARE